MKIMECGWWYERIYNKNRMWYMQYYGKKRINAFQYFVSGRNEIHLLILELKDELTRVLWKLEICCSKTVSICSPPVFQAIPLHSWKHFAHSWFWFPHSLPPSNHHHPTAPFPSLPPGFSHYLWAGLLFTLGIRHTW